MRSSAISPRWLVDASVAATWQAEAGFDYEIVSHEEHFDGERNHWRSQEVTETRVRWEPRLGKLQRRYENVPVPALEEEALIRRQLGDFAAAQAAAYRPESLENAVVALPNRSPEDAWEEARPLFGQRARRDCKQAAGADHMRSFRWTPQFTAPQWTQLLLPVYATHYQDDDGPLSPHPDPRANGPGAGGAASFGGAGQAHRPAVGAGGGAAVAVESGRAPGRAVPGRAGGGESGGGSAAVGFAGRGDGGDAVVGGCAFQPGADALPGPALFVR